jgi:phosphoribosyl-ATP pyrophosphohydrolase
MSEVADFTDTGKDLLIRVDLAHKALEKINAEIGEAVEAATAKINAEYTPVVFESQSVLYEAMAKAAAVGFTYKQLNDVMDCDGH